MKKKFLGLFCIISILLLNANSISSSLYTLLDSINDVHYFQGLSYITTGDFHDEIDIVQLDIDLNQIIVKFADQPVDDLSHLYSVDIFWDSEYFTDNYTHCQIGSESNIAITKLWNSENILVVNETKVDSINIASNTIVTPIPNFSVIQSPATPQSISVYAIFDSSSGFFNDTLTNKDTLIIDTIGGGFSSCYLVIGFSISFITLVFIKRKKKAYY